MIRPATLAVLAAALALPSLAHAAGDATKGAALFKQRCAACHVSEAGATPMAGPNLFGVVKRKAASTSFANYSDALKASGLTWTPAEIDAFLTAPNKKVPGTRMVISVPAPADRADLVAYLSTLKK